MQRVTGAIFGALLVALIVGLNVAVALTLDWLADWQALGLSAFVLLSGLTAVIAIHTFRFGVWWWVHRRMDLSRSAPLTALFFPAVFLADIARGSHPGWFQVAGVALITIGAAWATAIQEARPRSA